MIVLKRLGLLIVLLGKLLGGAAIFLALVVPVSFGIYGKESLVVGSAAATTIFLNNTVLGAIFVPRFCNLDELNKDLSQHFWKYVITSLLIGLMLGVGVGLGMNLVGVFNNTLAESFIKAFIIGFTVGSIGGFSGTLGLLPTSLNSQQKESFKEPPVFVAFVLFVLCFLFFGIPIGLNEALGAGLRSAVLVGLATVFIVGTLMFIGHKINKADNRAAGLAATQASLGLGIPFGCFAGLDNGINGGLFEAFTGSLGGTFGVCIGIAAGVFMGHLLEPVGREFPTLSLYLWQMRWPVISFAFGYGVIILVFATFYTSVSHVEGTFTGILTGSFGEFLRYSLLNALSVGDESIMAATPGAKALVAAEVVIGVAWIVVGFAAVIAYMEPRLVKFRTAEDDKELVRQLIEGVFIDKNPVIVINILASGHLAYDENNPDGTDGREWFKFFVARYPHLEFKVEYTHQVVRGGHVVTLWTLHWKEQSPQGKSGKNSYSNIDRILGGKVVETYTTFGGG